MDDIDDPLDRLVKHGAHLVSSEVVQYETVYRLCLTSGHSARSRVWENTTRSTTGLTFGD